MEEKKYKCDICKKCFKSRSSLCNVYIKGEFIFKNMCKNCGLDYIEKSGFLEEMGIKREDIK